MNFDKYCPIIFLCSAKLNAQESLSVYFLSGVRLSFCKHFTFSSSFPEQGGYFKQNWHDVSYHLVKGIHFFKSFKMCIYFFLIYLKKTHFAKGCVDSILFQSWSPEVWLSHNGRLNFNIPIYVEFFILFINQSEKLLLALMHLKKVWI